MASLLTVTFTHLPDTPGVLVVRRDADGLFYDFDIDDFAATPGTDSVVPTQDVSLPGLYRWSIVQDWSGLHQFVWYSDVAKTSAPTAIGVTLTVGELVDPLADLPTASEMPATLGLAAANLDAQLALVARTADIPDTEPADAPGTLRYTTEALSQAGGGGGGGTAVTIAPILISVDPSGSTPPVSQVNLEVTP